MVIVRLGGIAGWLGRGDPGGQRPPGKLGSGGLSRVCRRGLSGAKALEPRRNLVKVLP